MLELIAQGSTTEQQCRVLMADGDSLTIGRGQDSGLLIEWDAQVSIRHAQLTCARESITVNRITTAVNPLFFEGQSVDHCELGPGDHFVLGSTNFSLFRADGASPSPQSRTIQEVAFAPQELRDLHYVDAQKRIDVLTQLPAVIRGARVNAELYQLISNLLLAGIIRAEAVAIVSLRNDHSVETLYWGRREETAGQFHPSTRLVGESLDRQQQTLLHIFESTSTEQDDYTLVADVGWAFCTPINGPAAQRWGLYVSGHHDALLRQSGQINSQVLQGDVKFTEFVAEIIGSLLRENHWERQKTTLRQFLAPPIVDALGDELDTNILEPRECDVTVLFCDLRGFSQTVEDSADNPLELLARVSGALEIMTKRILHFGGVTGDFQGDAVLGFWGWPFVSEEAPLNACRAALAIRSNFAEFQNCEGHPLQNFQMGIGIAHGRAVAGKIGTPEQVKVTVFGPVVNLASRLESLTKNLRVPILMDAQIAEIVRRGLPAAEGRSRHLARVLPYGLENPVDVSELLPPAVSFGELDDELIAEYETGVEHFIAGRWEEAYRCLHSMPASDRAQDFLSTLITQHDRIAPSDWDGVVRLPHK
ncbi:MAG: adenylate/guanylate cyclase domain-containing protein [Planctomycetaceae bacterium]